MRELVSDTVAATTETAATTATKAVKLTGLARAAAASGNPVVAAKAAAATGRRRRPRHRQRQRYGAATTTTGAAQPPAGAAARRVIVITAAALAQVTSFKALMSLVSKVESGIKATGAAGTTTIDAAQSAANQAVAQSFLAQTDTVTRHPPGARPQGLSEGGQPGHRAARPASAATSSPATGTRRLPQPQSLSAVAS